MNVSGVLDAITADPLQLAAPAAAAAGAVLLYYVLGSRWLGPDDDYWSPLRHAVLPLLERAGRRLAPSLELYATGDSTPMEYAATVPVSVDELERVLAARGFDKNPWAAAKRSPDGRRSASSMAYRRVTRPRLRRVLDAARRLPLAGRVLAVLEAMLATRQVHVTLYSRGPRGAGADVYAHEEPNSVSPLVALAHYRAESHSVRRGVAWVQAHFDSWGVDYQTAVDAPDS